MTQVTSQPTPTDVQAFIGQVVTDLSAAFSGVLVNVGRKLGLYQAMADIGPCSSAALAEATGIRERYVREWLANQAAGGYVAYDAEKQTYDLPPAQAMVMALEQSPVFMASAFEVAASFWLDEDQIVETFRSGEGLGWHAHNHRLFCGTESFFRTGYRAHLVSEWLPALDGVVERLKRGARVADIGCGHGASTIMMAQAFPRSSFIGFDYHDASILTARERAASQGVSLAQIADYRCLIRHAAKRWRIEAARRNGNANATGIGRDGLFSPSLSTEEFAGYALFIAAHL